MQNIEFKAELRDPAVARQQCKVFGAHHIGNLHQTDTYYKLTASRSSGFTITALIP